VPETLAAELLLLAHDIRGKCRIGPAAMDSGVAGGLLSELALRGRLTVEEPVPVPDGPPVPNGSFTVGIDVVGGSRTTTPAGVMEGRVAVTDGPPTGDVILDELVAEIAATPRTPHAWLTHLRGPALTRRLLDRMIERGQVEVDHHRGYGLFAETWYPVRDVVGLWEAHRRVVLAATSNVYPDRRTPALGALAEAAGLGKVLFATSGDWRALSHHVRESSADDWAAGAVRRAVAAERRSTSV
jgi:hypothetical protein